MSRSLCWKYWDHVSNCWHTVPWHYVEQLQLQDHDDLSELPRQTSRPSYYGDYVPCEELPNLTIVDLIENSLLQRPHRLDLQQSNGSDVYQESRPPMPSPLMKTSLMKVNEELLAEKYDYRHVAASVPVKNSVLDVQITKRSSSRVASATTPEIAPESVHKHSSEPTLKMGIPIKADFSESLSQPTLIWAPQKKKKEKRNMLDLVKSKRNLTNISLLDSFKPPEGTVIKMTNPISRHARWIDPEQKRLGYKVEPIQGTKVRPPTALENFPCTLAKGCCPISDDLSMNSRPVTPIEIQRLRLLPSPIVRKCMDDALRIGVLDHEDTALILNRITKSKSAESPTPTDTLLNGDEHQANRQRLISPLKYARQPRPGGEAIYKMDSREVVKSQRDVEPIIFKPYAKSETVVPLHLEIPFFQNREQKLRRRMASWQRSLRDGDRVPQFHKGISRSLNASIYGPRETMREEAQIDAGIRKLPLNVKVNPRTEPGPLSYRPDAPPSSPCKAMFNSET